MKTYYRQHFKSNPHFYHAASVLVSCGKEKDNPDDYTGVRTVGLFINNTAKVYNGYTLVCPKTKYYDIPDQ